MRLSSMRSPASTATALVKSVIFLRRRCLGARDRLADRARGSVWVGDRDADGARNGAATSRGFLGRLRLRPRDGRLIDDFDLAVQPFGHRQYREPLSRPLKYATFFDGLVVVDFDCVGQVTHVPTPSLIRPGSGFVGWPMLQL